MGYSQIWQIKSIKRWVAAWPRLIADTRIIIDAADINLTSEKIWDLREVEKEHGGSEEALQKLLNPPPPDVDEEIGIEFNGIQNDGCEPFCLRKFPKSHRRGCEYVYSCKTNRREYDIVVCAVLIRAKQLLGDAFWAGMPIESDIIGDEQGWEVGFNLIALLFPEDHIPEECGQDWDDELEENYCISWSISERSPVPSMVEQELVEKMDTQTMSPKKHLPLDASDSLLNTVRQWVKECDSADHGHETCRTYIKQRPLPLLRLIDVERGCVVPAPPDPKYVALSYVWGNIPQTLLLSNNIDKLFEDNGFNKHGMTLSKTMADSMALCQRLGYRYLWVDALCIIQDNSYDKTLQLKAMRDVYRDAAVTIVAADGNNSNSGLGLAGRDSSFAISERADIWTSLTETLSKTVWETRGWTFQEKALSRRLLLFSPDGSFFICGTRIYSEHGFQRFNPDIVDDRPGRFFNVKSGLQLEMYLAAVQQYSKRKLTMESDFENAMRGIMKAFGSSMDGRANSFFQGLPISFFDELFCWRVSEHNPEARRKGFPSWSWQGWKQTPLFPEMIMNKIKLKHQLGHWGTHLLADDRSNYKIEKCESFGRTTAGPNPLMGYWKHSLHQVAMECREDIGATNGLFRVSSSINGEYIGMIQLHKKWRAGQPGTMRFLPIFIERTGEEVWIKMLMCIEPSLEPSRTASGPDDSFERVQVMDCDIEEKNWQVLSGKDVLSSKGRGGWDLSWIF